MTDVVLPENVRRLVAEHVDSVIALEVLLLMYRTPDYDWTAAEVAAELRVEEPWTHARLVQLERGGLLCSDQAKRFRYYPKSLDVNAAVAALASLYQERPLAVISYIYSKPSPIAYLSDAFRLDGRGGPHDRR